MRIKDETIEVLKMIQGIDKVNLGKIFCIDEDGRIGEGGDETGHRIL